MRLQSSAAPEYSNPFGVWLHPSPTGARWLERRATTEGHTNRGQSMLRNRGRAMGWGNVLLVAVFGAVWPIQAQDTKTPDAASPYPTMAPIAQYRMDRDAEIALARTAAPASI